MNDWQRGTFLAWAKLPVHERAVQRAERRVEGWLKKVSHPYVAFSTGKDSSCVLQLVRQQAPVIPAVYFDAGASFPESLEILETTPDMIRFPTTEPILEILRRFSFSAGDELENETLRKTVHEPIKALIAEYGFDGVAYGLRAEESEGRRKHIQRRGAIFQYRRDGLWGCQPICDWSFNDVWAFIISRGIPYCRLYDRLFAMGLPDEECRLSYWAGETKRRWGRWAILKQGWPDLFNRFAAEFPEVRCYV